MGVIEYNKDDADIEETLESHENEIINKLNAMQNQLNDVCQLLKELKIQVEQLKTQK